MSAAHNARVAARTARRGRADLCLLAMLMAITHSLTVAETRRNYTGALTGFWLSQVPDVATYRHSVGEARPDRLCAVNCEPDHSANSLDRLPKLLGVDGADRQSLATRKREKRKYALPTVTASAKRHLRCHKAALRKPLPSDGPGSAGGMKHVRRARRIETSLGGPPRACGGLRAACVRSGGVQPGHEDRLGRRPVGRSGEHRLPDLLRQAHDPDDDR